MAQSLLEEFQWAEAEEVKCKRNEVADYELRAMNCPYVAKDQATIDALKCVEESKAAIQTQKTECGKSVDLNQKQISKNIEEMDKFKRQVNHVDLRAVYDNDTRELVGKLKKLAGDTGDDGKIQ